MMNRKREKENGTGTRKERRERKEEMVVEEQGEREWTRRGRG